MLNPLHPAVVHFPIVLSVLLPFFAVRALWWLHRGARPAAAWSVPVVLSIVLAGSALVSVRTGEGQEERVERVVAERAFETHEETGERLLIASTVLVLLMAGGLAPGIIGRTARFAGTAAAVAVMGVAAYTGHTGGQLVYVHGAASAYATPQAQSSGASVDRDRSDEHP